MGYKYRPQCPPMFSSMCMSPTLFNIYMADIPRSPPAVNLTTYADDITIYSSDIDHRKAQDRIQPYLNRIHQWTKDNDLLLNTDKTMTTLFTPDPAEYKTKLTMEINRTRLPTEKYPKILGITFDPKLTYTRHITSIIDKARQSTKIIKTLTSTNWGKQKETITNTYKTLTRPLLEYASTVWSPVLAHPQTNKLQIIQNSALRMATGCTADTNITHLHDETKILPIDRHLRLHASQLRQTAQDPGHPLHKLTTKPPQPRYMKQTTFDNKNNYTINHDLDPADAIIETIKNNKKTIHTTIVQAHIENKPHNKILNRPAPDINPKETTLTRQTRRRLAQLRTDKSPLLMTYLHKIDEDNHPDDLCPLCKTQPHNTRHLFDCPDVPTDLTVEHLWTEPVRAADHLAAWGKKLGWPQGDE